MTLRLSFTSSQASAWTYKHAVWRRAFSSTLQHGALVGPPDPVSNLRPVIYGESEVDVSSGSRGRKNIREGSTGGNNEGDKGASSGEGAARLALARYSRTSPTHPYSLQEFDGDPSDYQWRIHRKRLDAFNHTFWADSNSRFEAAKQAVLSSLPESATTEAREAALSEFYKSWLRQERGRLDAYASEWNWRNFESIWLAARSAFQRFKSRIFGL